jgi:hypothetical protein
VTIQRNCRVIVEGDVWISGSLTVANSAQLVVSDSINLAGTVDGDRPSVMVDGATGVRFRNSSRATSNAAGVGFQLVTYWSGATCSPDCADVTGANLFTSSNVPTIYLEQSAQAPDSILYAKWSQVDLNNGGDIGALVGQTVKLRNSAAVTFGASVSGGGGGGAAQTWLVENYRRTFD